jgi:hypothetical protein
LGMGGDEGGDQEGGGEGGKGNEFGFFHVQESFRFAPSLRGLSNRRASI